MPKHRFGIFIYLNHLMIDWVMGEKKMFVGEATGKKKAPDSGASVLW
jgi:hypothetical protein